MNRHLPPREHLACSKKKIGGLIEEKIQFEFHNVVCSPVVITHVKTQMTTKHMIVKITQVMLTALFLAETTTKKETTMTKIKQKEIRKGYSRMPN